MKCNFCGMELSPRETVCPNCGAQNHEEVKEHQTGSVLRGITMVVRFLAGLFFVLGIYLNSYEAKPQEVGTQPGEIATMMQSYLDDSRFTYYESWRDTAAEFIDDYQTGNEMTYYGMEYLIRYGYYAMNDEDLPVEYRNQVELELKTILLDIVGVSEDEYALIYQRDPEYTYTARMPEEATKTLVEAMDREFGIER